MKIGIDVGGSHIGVGLVEGENLLTKLDHYYSQEVHLVKRYYLFSHQ